VVCNVPQMADPHGAAGGARAHAASDCENARREVHGYSWRTNKLTGEVIEGAPPVDGDDHIIDALRYATNMCSTTTARSVGTTAE
jgi:hypothetical protein